MLKMLTKGMLKSATQIVNKKVASTRKLKIFPNILVETQYLLM